MTTPLLLPPLSALEIYHEISRKLHEKGGKEYDFPKMPGGEGGLENFRTFITFNSMDRLPLFIDDTDFNIG